MVQSRVYFFTYLVHVGVKCQVFFKINNQFYRRIFQLVFHVLKWCNKIRVSRRTRTVALIKIVLFEKIMIFALAA